EPDEYDEIMADPIAAKYIRPFRMGREIVRGTDRWCLWLENLNPRDIDKSPILQKRLSAVAQFRKSSKATSTKAMANTPIFSVSVPKKTNGGYAYQRSLASAAGTTPHNRLIPP